MAKSKDNKLYNEKSIESLSPLEFTRLRPGVYCGDTAYSTQLLVEIISNAVDEFNLGHGNVIDVALTGNQVSVRDYGQGFLVNSVREDGKTILEAAFSVLNTSGKYREDGAYEGTSLGSFGIGSKITTYLSHWLRVKTIRDNAWEEVYFKEGEFSSRSLGVGGITGTLVEWEPSEEFFTDPKVEVSKIKDLFKTITCLCPGLTINLNDNGKEITYYSEKGLNDLVDGLVKDKELIDNRCNIKFNEGKNKLDFILTYTSDYGSKVVPYVNTGLTEKGPHISGIKTLLTREFNKFFRDKKWLKEKEENLTGDDIQEGMYIVFNITAPGISYDAQVKSTITKIDMTPFTTALTTELGLWMVNNEKDVKLIADKALAARRAREAAQKAREKAREGNVKGLKAKMQLSDKFIDCTSKKPEERNLLLLEGLSAGSSAIEARNVKTDCIYMLRGKTISPLRTSVDKILANQEMSDIIRVIGAGFGDKFDINKMQFDKIVITSDADSDGDDIALLLTTFFFTYMRPLVEAGKLYRAVTPLYIVRKKDEELYFYNDDEYNKWAETASGSYDLVRAKGLGELNPADLHDVCFKDQRFKRLTVSDCNKTVELLNILEGPSANLRKQYIYDNAEKLGFEFD